MELDKFPLLLEWYGKQERNYRSNELEVSLESICWNLAHSLNFSGNESFSIWYTTLKKWMDHSPDFKRDFQIVDSFMCQLGLDLLDQFMKWGEESFDLGFEDKYLLLMQSAANKTNLEAFNFIVAWLAFNMDDYSLCIQMSNPSKNAPFCILRGQAYLAIGEVLNAKDAFEEALDYSPNDPLAWFQLAKAEWAQDRFHDAWRALLVCYDITLGTAEIAMFMGMIALQVPTNKVWQKDAWDAMYKQLLTSTASFDYVVTMIQLAIRSGEINWMSSIVNKVSWGDFKSHLLNSKKFGSILQSLHVLGWHDISKSILDDLIEQN